MRTLACGLLILVLSIFAATGLEAGQSSASSGQQSAGSTTPAPSGTVTFDSTATFDVLDPTTNINRKILLLLEQRRRGTLADNSVRLGVAVTAITNYQHSNTVGKFGYLMRHPTASNEVGTNVSEAVIHSAQVSFTGTTGTWITAHAELLYDPEQSFGAGTTTALGRNQLQLRQGYVVLGNLDASPLYFSLGKMATPFGLTDTVSPFTASTVWHAFGGLAYGAQAGYNAHGLALTAMAVQGGAQFRSANTPVEGTAVPSALNNYVLDANYTGGTDAASVMVGGSYQRGTTYCQDYPVTHFALCSAANPAFDVYGQLTAGHLTVQAELARTRDVWPGTFNPDLPEFAASKVTSFDVGGKYRTTVRQTPVHLSADFSRFLAGPSGAPWHRQDQLVFGIAAYPAANAKFFAEYAHIAGYAPLNFISGGNLGVGVTHSVDDARSHVVIAGINIVF